jgi:hypothetical protein
MLPTPDEVTRKAANASYPFDGLWQIGEVATTACRLLAHDIDLQWKEHGGWLQSGFLIAGRHLAGASCFEKPISTRRAPLWSTVWGGRDSLPLSG